VWKTRGLISLLKTDAVFCSQRTGEKIFAADAELNYKVRRPPEKVAFSTPIGMPGQGQSPDWEYWDPVISDRKIWKCSMENLESQASWVCERS
jgi:hypothetical protein